MRFNGVRAAKASNGRCLAADNQFTKKQLRCGADWCAENLAKYQKEALECYDTHFSKISSA